MKKISLPHLFGYWVLLCLSPLPVLYFLMRYSSSLEHLKQLDERIEAIHIRKEQTDSLKKREHSLLSSFSDSDPFYIDKYLETLTFLESESKKMESLASEGLIDESLLNRLQFLKSSSNRLLFSEEKMRHKENMREVFENQQHPVEINEEDLKKLLCLIEGVTIWPYGPREGRPQLIVQDIQFTKKRYSPQDHVYSVTLNLIKRENFKEPSS
ncbi:MAG TPA: hypothetical protein VGJ00_02035 [Rhabdochlamydiaceae bacterium]|jgi:hypothetical protein